MTTTACENDLVNVLTQGCQTPGPCFTFEKQTNNNKMRNILIFLKCAKPCLESLYWLFSVTFKSKIYLHVKVECIHIFSIYYS